MPSDEFITIPTGRADLVVASIPRQSAPERDAVAALTDPTNYAHVLDVREDT